MSYLSQELCSGDGIEEDANYKVKNVFTKKGAHIYKGRRICELISDCLSGSIIIKAKYGGTVSKILIGIGDNVSYGSTLLEMKACSHPTVLGNICCDCGVVFEEKPQESRNQDHVSMLHSIPDLKVSKEEAARLGNEDIKHLLDKRKLVLLVDLDQTLIHTTNDNIPPKLKDVFHFQLVQNGPWYHTRLRPYTLQFLSNISKLYELHICTFGIREYAHCIANFLDPDRKLFGDRILSRNECLDSMSKKANLSSLFPCGDNLVCIIDDRSDVWNFAPNVVQVMPYHFFQHTGDINAPPGLQKKENDNISKGFDFSNLEDLTAPAGGGKKRKDDNEKEEIEEDLTAPAGGGKNRKDDNEKEEIEEDLTAPAGGGKKRKDDNEKEEIEEDLTAPAGGGKKRKDDNEKEEIEEDLTAPAGGGKKRKDDNEKEEIEEDLTAPAGGGKKRKDDNEKEEIEGKENILKCAVDKENIDVSNSIEETENCDISKEVDSNSLKKSYDEPQVEVSDHASDDSNTEKNNAKEVSMPEIECNSKSETNTNSSENNQDNGKCQSEDKSNTDTSDFQDSKDIHTQKEIKDTCDEILTGNKVVEDDRQTVKSSDSQNDSDTVDVEDNDDYLLYLEDILTNLHKCFYSSYDPLSFEKDKNLPDLKLIVPEVRRKVLQGFHLVLSGIVPQNTNLKESKAYHIATSLGATVSDKIFLKPRRESESLDFNYTTHVIAANLHTEKVHQAKKFKNIKIVTPDWLWCCAERWEKVDERLFKLTEDSQRTLIRNPPMHCFINLFDDSMQKPQLLAMDSSSSRPSKNENLSLFKSLNPLAFMSNDEARSMEDEVDDILLSEEEDQVHPTARKDRKEGSDDNSSDDDDDDDDDSSNLDNSEKSNGEDDDDIKERERKRRRRTLDDDLDEDFDLEEDEEEEELPSIRFRQGGSLPSDDGEADSADEDMNAYGDILERELMRD